jgi:hypothetical protein
LLKIKKKEKLEPNKKEKKKEKGKGKKMLTRKSKLCSCGKISRDQKKIEESKEIKEEKEKEESKDEKQKVKKKKIYAEFINTFILNDDDEKNLPTILPGGSFEFPISTISSGDVKYIAANDDNGLLVPRGDYLASLKFNPSVGASVSLLVNGKEPLTDNRFPYTRTFSVGLPEGIDENFLINAPLKRDNLISIVNVGRKPLTLNILPNTEINVSQGKSGIIFQIRLQRQ